MAKKPAQIYQIKVTLDDTHPPIWRRILAPEYALHQTLGEEFQELSAFQVTPLGKELLEAIKESPSYKRL